MADQWYFAKDGLKDGQIHGPFDFDQLASYAAFGHFEPTDQVRCSTSNQWSQAGSVEGLFPSQPTASSTELVKQPVEPIPRAVQTTVNVLAIGLGVWFFVCWSCGPDCINTRLRWPWIYGHHDWAAFPCTLLVAWALRCFIVAFPQMCDAKSPIQLPPIHLKVVMGVISLFLAALLLQTLPRSTSGLQLIPLLPQNYVSWIASACSVVCWIMIAIGGIGFAANQHEGPIEATALALVGILGAGLLSGVLSFCDLKPEASAADAPRTVKKKTTSQSDQLEKPPSVTKLQDAKDFSALVQSYKDKIFQLEQRKAAQTKATEKLVESKQSLLEQIKQLGITNKQELMAHKAGKDLAEELGELVGMVTKLINETEVVDLATQRFQSRLRRIERQVMLKDLGLSMEEEYKQLSQIDRELQEELRKMTGQKPAGAEVQLDKTLNEVFGSKGK